ncbi:MAG: hypothetical protein D6748_06685, partial [Calditrichaeota bacterium]
MVFILFSTLFLNAQTSVEEWISRGDSAYQQFNNLAALGAYQQALKLDSLNYEALWKISRAYVDVGETLKKKEERRQYYQEAEKFARKAVAVNPDGAKGHLFLSIALGRVA